MGPSVSTSADMKRSLRGTWLASLAQAPDGRAAASVLRSTYAGTVPGRREYSIGRIAALSDELAPVRPILHERGLCIYVTGSYGRLEAGEHSDVDPFFLHDARDGQAFPFPDLVRVMARLIDAAESLGFPAFSGDGRYLTVQSVAQVESVLGSPEDDSLNAFTARLLLLLESRPLADEQLYDRLLERILGFYYRDFEDHQHDFVPLFLLNDILRFWRTLTLNYEHHRLKLLPLTGEELERKKGDSALKNYKLKFSRMKTCFSMALRLGAAPAPIMLEDVLNLCRRTPTERLATLSDLRPESTSLVNDLTERYEHFLEVVQRPEHEAVELFRDSTYRKRALEDAKSFGDRIFELVQLVVPPERLR